METLILFVIVVGASVFLGRLFIKHQLKLKAKDREIKLRVAAGDLDGIAVPPFEATDADGKKTASKRGGSGISKRRRRDAPLPYVLAEELKRLPLAVDSILQSHVFTREAQAEITEAQISLQAANSQVSELEFCLSYLENSVRLESSEAEQGICQWWTKRVDLKKNHRRAERRLYVAFQSYRDAVNRNAPKIKIVRDEIINGLHYTKLSRLEQKYLRLSFDVSGLSEEIQLALQTAKRLCEAIPLHDFPECEVTCPEGVESEPELLDDDAENACKDLALIMQRLMFAARRLIQVHARARELLEAQKNRSYKVIEPKRPTPQEVESCLNAAIEPAPSKLQDELAPVLTQLRTLVTEVHELKKASKAQIFLVQEKDKLLRKARVAVGKERARLEKDRAELPRVEAMSNNSRSSSPRASQASVSQLPVGSILGPLLQAVKPPEPHKLEQVAVLSDEGCAVLAVSRVVLDSCESQLDWSTKLLESYQSHLKERLGDQAADEQKAAELMRALRKICFAIGQLNAATAKSELVQEPQAGKNASQPEPGEFNGIDANAFVNAVRLWQVAQAQFVSEKTAYERQREARLAQIEERRGQLTKACLHLVNVMSKHNMKKRNRELATPELLAKIDGASLLLNHCVKYCGVKLKPGAADVISPPVPQEERKPGAKFQAYGQVAHGQVLQNVVVTLSADDFVNGSSGGCVETL
jgi:hypothetical protein